MTLHSTAEAMKKFGIGSSIGIGAIIVLVIFFKIGVVIKNIIFPPKIEAANQAYGKLPLVEFPQSTINQNFTYDINTLSGKLPDDFPDRLIIYKMVSNPPNLLNLDTVKKRVEALGFVDQLGGVLPEIPRGGSAYEWDEQGGIDRKIIYDIVTFDFNLTSAYLTSLNVTQANYIKDEATALATVQGMLGSIGSFTPDIDLTKTTTPDPKINYLTKPQLFSIDPSTGQLVRASSLSNTQVIRVDLYQKDIEYTLTAGLGGSNLTSFKDFDQKLPILYPHPPYSTMNFLVASGENAAQVVSAIYSHQTVDLNQSPDQPPATYPIKTADEAFTDLKAGKGYVAAYHGTDSQILINNVSMAYYIGEKQQQYLQPVIVFEGPNGFFAYVPAIKDEALGQ